MLTRNYAMKSLRLAFLAGCMISLNCTRCESVVVVDDNADATRSTNVTFVGSILDSVVGCWSPNSRNDDGVTCLKSKFYKICERYLRDRLSNSFDEEERVELLRYQPVVKKMIRILEKDSDGSWLDTKITNYVRMLFDESMDDNEGRKKKNKGIGQILMFSLISGLAVMLPLVFKVVAAMAAKALVAGKVAMIISAMLYFNKLSHHDHDSVHETSLRRQTII